MNPPDAPYAKALHARAPLADAPPADAAHAEGRTAGAPHERASQAEARQAEASPADAPHSAASPLGAPPAERARADAGGSPVAASGAAVVVEALRYRWPGAKADVLRIDALQVARGETLFLRGPSGCGKSTLLSLLAGVLVGEGRVEVLGRSWAALSAAARDRFRADHVGYIFQQFNLLPYLSVLDNVRLPCRFSRRRAERTPPGGAEALLADTGLARDLWRRPAGALSIGQQQRIAAARALVGSPELVIADEPTSALDEDARASFMELLLGECARAGSALVFVSHDARLAARFQRQLELPAINRAPG
jgi:putative ABC transport system ATP-binding protein